METELFHAGILPAVNPGISVSRVGGNAQIKAMKQVAGKLKLVYSQYRELQSFAQFGSDLDSDTKTRLAQGERIVKVLGQGRGKPVPMAKQVCIFYAVIHDYLMDIEVDQVPAFEEGFYDYLDGNAPDILQAILTSGKLEEETETKLRAAIEAYKKQFAAMAQA